MTREEAILLSSYTGFLLAPDFSEVHKFCEDTLGRPIWTHEFADRCVQKEIQAKLRPQIMELVQNISTLRPVNREQVEKVWRGEWMALDECSNEGVYCKRCKKKVYRIEYANEKMRSPFCPACGAAQTDEAVEITMKRLEELKDGSTTDKN